jgi:hypothetical protein
LRFQEEPVLPIDWLFEVPVLAGGLLVDYSGTPPIAAVFGGEVPLSICVRISFVYLSLY